jgi:hypothetical protein
MMDDQELQALFSDPADQEVVDLLRSSRPAPPPLDPHFRNYLRAKLMADARDRLAAPTGRRWFQVGPVGMAPAMAAVAAGFLIVLAIGVYLHGEPAASTQVAVNVTAIDNRKDVATAEPIQIPFSGPVDKTAVEESVVIQPATSFTKHWEGQTLVITPAHPLAANTSYKVTLQPKAAPLKAAPPKLTAAPTAAPQRPVVVHFLTAPAPVAPIVPPSYGSGSVSWSYDNRLPESSTLSSPAWTPDGQLLVTRASLSAGPTPTATATASPTAGATPKAATDIWLMSIQGTQATFVRDVAPGGTYPAVAPSGGAFADWQETSPDRSTLEVRDLQGNVQVASVATVNGRPDGAAVWLGADRLAYVNAGALTVVDLHGTIIAAPVLQVSGAMAASRNGLHLALKSTTGSVVLDLTSMQTAPLPDGAAGFAWSPGGQLAFTITQATGTALYAGSDAKSAHRIATSPAGETWSDLNWAPDSASLLLASHTGVGTAAHTGLLLINADGSAPAPFGSIQREYASPRWSPHGDLVLFSRPDEARGTSLWTAKAVIGQPSAVDTAQAQALAEIDKFMQARISGNLGTAQAQLDATAKQAYATGASALLSPGAPFVRYYPVSVQLTGPNKFLIGARVFIARNNQEVSFFEEQLTVVLQDQRYLIDAVTSGPTVQLGHGPTVVSVEVHQNGPAQQVLVRFDADLKPGTISADTVLIKDSQGAVVPAVVTFDPDGHLVTVDARLRPGSYSLVVTTGVADINGAPVSQDYSAPLVIGG